MQSEEHHIADIQHQQHPSTTGDLQLLAISLSLTVAGKVADNLWITWAQVCQAFRDAAQRISSSKDGLLICFAQFANDYRLGSIATDLYAVCLDFDHGTTEQLNASLALAQRLSTRGIVHTTWSDEPNNMTNLPRGGGARCWRVIIPLDTPVSSVQWPETWAAFANTFLCKAGAVADTQCKNINRRYYVPMAKQFVHDSVTVPALWTWGE